jgi:hypothetical protein
VLGQVSRGSPVRDDQWPVVWHRWQVLASLI